MSSSSHRIHQEPVAAELICSVSPAQGMSANDLKYNNTPSTSFTYSRRKHVQFQKALHSLNPASCHMHQYTHQHTFTPVLHQSPACFPVMGAQHSHNFIQHGWRPSFTPVPVFHRDTHKSFKSAVSFNTLQDFMVFLESKKRGRWGALHACIAWQIYYHKKLKEMQPNPNSPHQDLSSSLPDSGQRSCIHLHQDSICGQSAYGENSEIGKTTGNRSHLIKSHPPDCCTSSTVSSQPRTTKEEPRQTNWKVKTEEKLDACSNVLPLKVKSWDHTAVTQEPDGRRDTVSHGRKRPLEYDRFIKVKRVKQEVEDGPLYHTDVSSHSTTVQHVNTSDTSALYCHSSGCNASYPGAEMFPYQTASWEHMWNEFKRMNHSLTQQLRGDYLQNAYKVFKMFPRAMRQQETAQLSRRQFLNRHHLHHCCHSATTSHLPHPDFLAASYTGL